MHIPTSQSSLVQSRPRAPIELLPMHGRVIVRVAASTMNSLDHKILAYGILAQEWPWVGGNEYAGTVVAVGPSVESLKLGDRITATAVNFIEGQEVSGWQQYALLQADLCTKIPEHVSFENACTLPTSFAAASIAIAIELGLKYPDGPPPPPKKTSAMIWQEAMASLGNGATFGWNLEEGTVQGGRWYPNPPSSIEAPLPTPEQLEEQRRIKERQEEAARLHAELTRAMTEQIGKHGLRATVRNPSGNVPGFTGPRPNPMLWGAGDFSREAMDRQWGSGWENGGAYRRIEVVDERQDGKVLGLGLDIGPQADDWRSSGLVARWEGSGSGSTSASTSMGRSGSDESNTSDGIHMHTSCPNPPPVSGSVGRRGSEPSLRLPGPTALMSGSIFRSSPFSTGSLPNRPNSSASTKRPSAGGRGSSSPFRVPATLSHRGRGRGSPPYVRELSPLGVRREQELGNHAFPFSINSAATRHSVDFLSRGTDHYSFDGPQQSREVVPSFDPWSGSAGGAPVTVAELGDAFFPSPLLPVTNPVYVMDEPILIWGGSTGIGRAALQLLTRAGYTNLFVVAASERHPELRELVPPGTKVFDYRHPDVVVQIRAALGARKLTKVLDTIAMPNTLKPISQLVEAGATLASALPVRTPMPDGVEVKPVMFGRCHDYTGKDVLSFKFGKERMWPLLGDLLRKDQWVFPPMVHLRGGLHACATDAMRMMASGENAGKRLVLNIEATRGSGIKV